jgi:ketosteroid isomerase-like protein
MRQDDVEALRRGYEAWNRGDYEAVLELLDPAIEWRLPEGGINSGSHHGREAVRELMGSYLEAFDHLQLDPERFFQADDRVVVFVRQAGRGRGSGVEVEIQVGHVWTMRAGRAVRFEIVPKQDEALAKALCNQNLERLRAFLEEWDLEAWRRGEADMSLLDPAVTYEDANLPDHVGETYNGHEGVARATERWLEPFESLTVGLERIVVVDNRLVSIHSVKMRALHTHIEFEGPLAYLWTFRDGKVVHFRSFRDPEEALEEACR